MDVAPKSSDRSLFKELKAHFTLLRDSTLLSSLFSLKKLKHIRFVQFELYHSSLADVRKQNDIPPEIKAHEYRYSPIPADIIPPVGENHMMHLYEHPEDAETTPDCFDKVPKKLREPLAVCSGQKTRIGWGIYFIEGLHWMKLWGFGFVGLVASFSFGLCWSIVRDDIQGGFAIAACLMVLFTSVVGALQAGVDGV